MALVNDDGFQANLAADILDEETAAFAEANYWLVPDKLRMTAGVRYSKVELDYNQLNYGQFSGRHAHLRRHADHRQHLGETLHAETRHAVPAH